MIKACQWAEAWAAIQKDTLVLPNFPPKPEKEQFAKGPEFI